MLKLLMLLKARIGRKGQQMAFKSVLESKFKYRNAVSTDVRKTFERARREQQLAKQRRAGQQANAKTPSPIR